MHNRLGTKSRLAAHLTALVLLVLLLVYVGPTGMVTPEEDPLGETPAHPSTPVATAPIGEETPRSESLAATPPTAAAAGEPIASPATTQTEDAAAASHLHREDDPVMADAGESADRIAGDTPGGALAIAKSSPGESVSGVPSERAERGEKEAATGPGAAVPQPMVADAALVLADGKLAEFLSLASLASGSGLTPDGAMGHLRPGGPMVVPLDVETVTDTRDVAEARQADNPEEETAEETADVQPAMPQPDESGAMLLAPGSDAVPVTPIANANLEVLGNNVYWLDPQYDLEKELAAIPEIGTLILLTPLPGFVAGGFEHIRTEAIPADLDDISEDAAEHFLYLTADAQRPVVAAALPGARGAAFFKGVYLLARRNLDIAEVAAELAPELEEAGDSAEGIVRRLRQMDLSRDSAIP